MVDRIRQPANNDSVARGRWWLAPTVWMGAAALLAAVVIVLVIVGLSSINRISAERDRAEGTTLFIAELLDSFDPADARGADTAIGAALDAAVMRAELQLRDQPLVEASVLAQLGRLYQQRGEYHHADTLLGRSLEIRREHLDEDDLELAEGHYLMAELRRAEGDMIADSLYGAAIAAYERELDDGDRRLLRARVGRAMLLHDAKQYDRARAIFRYIVDDYRSKYEDDPEALGDDPIVADAMLHLGGLLLRQGNVDEARTTLTDALAMQRRMHGELTMDAAELHDALGTLYYARTDYDLAERAFRRALEIRQQLRDSLHPSIARSYFNIGIATKQQKHYNAADSLLNRSLDIYRHSYNDGDSVMQDIYWQLEDMERERMRDEG